jgi:hypothetical protein
MTVGAWALFLACLAGIVLSAGLLTRFRDAAAVAALVLFAVAAVCVLIPVM